MGNPTILFLSALYCLLFIVFAWNFYRSIKTNSGILFNICHAMYILIYAFIPMLVHYHVYSVGQSEKHYSTLNYDNLWTFSINYIFIIIGYLGLRLGYKSKTFRNLSFDSTPNRTSTWFISATISLLVGIFCLYKWTAAFGGPKGILIYASALRTGYDVGIENLYTVYKRFVPLVQFANIIYLGLFLKKRNISYLLFFLISTYYSFLYLLANDGRAPLVMHFASLLWLFFAMKKKTIHLSKKNLIKIVTAGLMVLFIIHNMDYIAADYLFISEEKREVEYDFDIASSIREEFSYTVRNNQAIFEYWEEHPATFRLPIEILSGILGILPSSFRPSNIEKLEKVNTYYWDRSQADNIYFGGRPPDLIVTGIYTLNIFGVFLLPFILGVILKYVETKRSLVSSKFDNDIFYALVLYPVMRIVAYTNFDGLMLNFFYIILGYLIKNVIQKFYRA